MNQIYYHHKTKHAQKTQKNHFLNDLTGGFKKKLQNKQAKLKQGLSKDNFPQHFWTGVAYIHKSLGHFLRSCELTATTD